MAPKATGIGSSSVRDLCKQHGRNNIYVYVYLPLGQNRKNKHRKMNKDRDRQITYYIKLHGEA